MDRINQRADSRPRVLIVVNVDWYFLSHRHNLARALRATGCEVIVAAAPERDMGTAIEEAGFRFVPIPVIRRSMGVIRELRTFAALYVLYLRERPSVVHHVSIKPVLYGSLAARAAGVHAVVNTIPGLGYMFLGRGVMASLRRWAVMLGYRVALRGEVQTVFQNPDDLALFVSKGLVRPAQATLIRGSGVDITRFVPAPEPPGVPVILLAARLLWDKGVGELVDAARALRQTGESCRVVLVGLPDPANPRSVDISDIRAWEREGILEWWGHQQDMAETMHRVHVVVLPSYREGVPKILLEAAAAGRPIVATDVPGCREVVRHGENGYLVPVRDAERLREALSALVRNAALRVHMGRRGREIVEEDFADQRVVEDTFAVYRRAGVALPTAC